MLVRKRHGLSIINSCTLKELVGKEREGTRLEYAPLCVHLRDTCYTHMSEDVIITSVHFPPNSSDRVRARDLCYNTLFNGNSYYNTVNKEMGGTGQKSIPWTTQGAKESKINPPYPATYIICGDFNKTLDDVIGDYGHWKRQGEELVITSAGGNPYDYFVINKDAMQHAYGDFPAITLLDTAIEPNKEMSQYVGIEP